MNSPEAVSAPGYPVSFGLRIATLAILGALATGCREDLSPKEITNTREIKQSGGLHWSAPAGWTRGPERNMRLVTYVPEGHPDAECYITVLSGRAGGVAANINRWRQQMARPELTADELAALPDVTVLGRPEPFVEIEGDFSGMSGDAGRGYLLLGVVCPLPDALITVKMIGPAASVRAEKTRFIEFCESLHD